MTNRLMTMDGKKLLERVSITSPMICCMILLLHPIVLMIPFWSWKANATLPFTQIISQIFMSGVMDQHHTSKTDIWNGTLQMHTFVVESCFCGIFLQRCTEKVHQIQKVFLFKLILFIMMINSTYYKFNSLKNTLKSI